MSDNASDTYRLEAEFLTSTTNSQMTSPNCRLSLGGLKSLTNV